MATPEAFRGFTHPVTNLTNIGSSDAQALLAGLVQGRLDESLLFSLIHEATHHWCFMSPLGEALAIIHFQPLLTISDRSTGDGGEEEDDEDDARYRVGDDLLSYDQVTGLLRPLIEGMAVFAEFDLVPDPDSPTMSLPLSSTLFLFLRDRLRRVLQDGSDPAQAGDELLYSLLMRLRTTTGVRRKAGVLGESLGDVQNGHLAGYLFVKNLWAQVGHEGRRLSADEFLSFLHSYFFSDMRMVHELLVPDDGVTDRFQRVTAAFNQRMQELLDGSAARYIAPVREWNRERLSAPTLGETVYSFFQDGKLTMDLRRALPPVNDPQVAEEGWRRLQQHLEDLRNSEAPTRRRIAWLLARRDRIRLVGADVDVRRPSSQTRVVVTASGEMLLAGPAVEGCTLPTGDHHGQVDAYYVPFLGVSYITVSVDGKVVLFLPSSEMSTVMSEQVRNYTEGGVAELEQLEQLRELARNYAVEETAMSVLLPGVPSQLQSWYESAIVPSVFPKVPVASREHVLAELGQKGLLAVCESLSDLKALAWLSVAGSLQLPLPLAERVFDSTRGEHGLPGTVAELLARLGDRSDAVLGERVIRADSERLTTLV